MFWPFRRRKQYDAFGRPVTARPPAPARAADAFFHAPDATPDDVPNGMRVGFDGYELPAARGPLTGLEGGRMPYGPPPYGSN